MIKEYVLVPSDLVVAIRALRAHGTLVHVVVCVASEAIRAGRCVEQWLHMTCAALRTRVRAIERVTRVPRMFKPHLWPRRRCMATFTLLAEMAIVLIVFLVTRHTGHVEPVGKRVRAVARGAILLRVGPV